MAEGLFSGIKSNKSIFEFVESGKEHVTEAIEGVGIKPVRGLHQLPAICGRIIRTEHQ